mmetsp:Transcript_10925/g.19004  ORF Transcript_10925/g.19004 Transcript_10925/m.19004 type:complete len:332 (+) Transcript_10925:75-1070(+)
MARTCLALFCLFYSGTAFATIANELEACVGEACVEKAFDTINPEGLEMLQIKSVVKETAAGGKKEEGEEDQADEEEEVEETEDGDKVEEEQNKVEETEEEEEKAEEEEEEEKQGEEPNEFDKAEDMEELSRPGCPGICYSKGTIRTNRKGKILNERHNYQGSDAKCRNGEDYTCVGYGESDCCCDYGDPRSQYPKYKCGKRSWTKKKEHKEYLQIVLAKDKTKKPKPAPAPAPPKGFSSPGPAANCQCGRSKFKKYKPNKKRTKNVHTKSSCEAKCKGFQSGWQKCESFVLYSAPSKVKGMCILYTRKCKSGCSGGKKMKGAYKGSSYNVN